jgi:hypothetical protein
MKPRLRERPQASRVYGDGPLMQAPVVGARRAGSPAPALDRRRGTFTAAEHVPQFDGRRRGRGQ